MNETMVTVTGNIAGEVTSRRVGADERLLVSFRVASSERRWDKASGEWVDGDRFSASVSCWRRLAEGVQTSLVKGDPVVVSGRLSVREYEVNGERRYSTEIAAVSVGPDLARSSARVTRRRLAAGEAAAEGASADPFDVPAGTMPGSAFPAATAAAATTGATPSEGDDDEGAPPEGENDDPTGELDVSGSLRVPA